LIETAKIVCPNKLKDFQSISLTWNRVAECIGDIEDNLTIRLCNISKHFEDFSIAVDESTDVSDNLQCSSEVATQSLLLLKNF
jgi:hypothetical protein